MLTFTISGLLIAAFYYYLTRTFDYWKKRGVKHDKPIPFFGTSLKNLIMRANMTEATAEMYRKYPNEQIVGSFRGTRPELIIRDPELAKIITVRDFSFFHRRGIVVPSPNTVLLKQLVTSDDDMWHLLRRCWTPAFSSSKIKSMFPVLMERTESLQARLKAVATSNQPFNAKDLIMRFTNDVMGSIIFDIKCDSINNDDDTLRQLGKNIFQITVPRVIKQTLRSLMRRTFKHLNLLGDVEKEAIEMVQSVMKHRNYEPSSKRDFLDLLLEVKKKGGLTGESIVEMNDDGTPKKVSIEMNDSLVAAQCLLFYAGGFEPTSSIASYTMHELAHNPHILEKVQKEIDNVLLRHDNELSYDAITEMTYLRLCLNESVRIFPFGGPLVRESVATYTFPGTNVTIDPGVRVVIPLKAYHNDPEIFPEPQEFQPERLDPAVMTPEQKAAYLPFGSGPRACVAERLAMTLAMAGLVAVLSKYSVLPAPGAPRHAALVPVSNVANLLTRGLPLVIQERTRD